MKNENDIIYDVSIERQLEGSKIIGEVYQACKYIAEELIRIWELWDLEGSNSHFYHISSDNRITFMQRGCMGERASEAEWLFHHKTIWIREVVFLTRDNIANPEIFLSNHREYRQKYDKYLFTLEAEKKQREKEERRYEFEKLRTEFGTKVNGQ